MQRSIVKDMLQEWERRHPGRLDNMLRALANVAPSHLADAALFDFAGIEAHSPPAGGGDIAFDDEPLPRDVCGPRAEGETAEDSATAQ
jgi:tRNA 2-thiocytidine biosynthesis protein TtcA